MNYSKWVLRVLYATFAAAELVYLSAAQGEELLLVCTRHVLDAPSAPEIEVAIKVDLEKRTATLGENKAQSVTITADTIKLEFAPVDVSQPSICDEKIYQRRSASINRINGQIWEPSFADTPSLQCLKAFSKADVEWPKSDVMVGKCVKTTKRAF